MPAPALSFLGELGLPETRDWLIFAGPFLALWAAWWLIRHSDFLFARLFPYRDWERQMGWFNTRLDRRVDGVMRWIRYLVYFLLAVALYGIVWSAEALPLARDWSDPYKMAELTLRVPVLLVSLGLWFVYLGCLLLPKLRRQYEEEDLQKFREQMRGHEEEYEPRPRRGPGSLPKPRTSAPTSPVPRSRRMGPGA